MKITKIVVKDLFGIFDQEIQLNTKENITIINAPNGYGKTIILRLINSVFNRKFSDLLSIPFNFIQFYFLKDKYIKIINNRIFNKRGLDIEFNFNRNGRKIKKENIHLNDYEIKSWPERKCISKLKTIRIPKIKGEPVKILLNSTTELSEIIDNYNVHFITTKRLLQINEKLSEQENKVDKYYYEPIEDKHYYDPTIELLSKDIIEKMESTQSEYIEIAQLLDRTYPFRLLNQDYDKFIKKEEIYKEIQELEKVRNSLVESGFLKKDNTLEIKDISEKINKINIGALTLYVKDEKEKFTVFTNLKNKIELFINIINKKLRNKKLEISKEVGFLFKVSGNNYLKNEYLSSGEKHQVIMFYDLIFKTKPKSLVLIDEPELSLHVIWQHEFVKNLLKIAKMIKFNILIATHSPQIIHDRWDLTVSLKDPNPNKKMIVFDKPYIGRRSFYNKEGEYLYHEEPYGDNPYFDIDDDVPF